eukprot:scaffold69517_cov22-Prasinocladus_malaysianus.AAC.1
MSVFPADRIHAMALRRKRAARGEPPVANHGRSRHRVGPPVAPGQPCITTTNAHYLTLPRAVTNSNDCILIRWNGWPAAATALMEKMGRCKDILGYALIDSRILHFRSAPKPYL